MAEGRREWTIVGDRFGPTEVLEGPVLPHDVQVRVVEVGVSPEEEGPKFSKSELAQGSSAYRQGWHDGYEAAEARERHPAEGQPGPWPGSVYNADGVAVYRAEARERGEDG